MDSSYQSMPVKDYCTFCGVDDNNLLDNHHIVPARYGGSDENTNLVTVCKNCHRNSKNYMTKIP